MGFTVYREGGTKDGEFEAYARLLRQKGKDLGHLPRVPEPGTDRRWLYVWNTKSEAEAFAKEMRKRTGDTAWKVLEVPVAEPDGPLGPLIVQMGRQSTGLTFSLHPLSRELIKSAFPEAFGTFSVFIDLGTWTDFRKRHGDLRGLVRKILPSLSGLSEGELDHLGYEVVDDITGETLFTKPPAMPAQV